MVDAVAGFGGRLDDLKIECLHGITGVSYIDCQDGDLLVRVGVRIVQTTACAQDGVEIQTLARCPVFEHAFFNTNF